MTALDDARALLLQVRAYVAMGGDVPPIIRDALEALADLIAEHERTVTTEYHDSIVAEAQRQIHELEGQIERLTAPPTKWSCSTPGCPGDGRYAAPGRGHLGECRFPLTAPPTADEREAVVAAIYSSGVWRYEVADRILASDVWRNHRQGPITATEVIAAAKWWAESGNGEHLWPEYVKPMRGVLEAARDA